MCCSTISRRSKTRASPGGWRTPLPEALPLLVCGTIADCDDCDHIAAWGEAHLAFLRKLLPCHHGVADVVAIDGKTSRRSHDRSAGEAPLQLVSAFATTARHRQHGGPRAGRHCRSDRWRSDGARAGRGQMRGRRRIWGGRGDARRLALPRRLHSQPARPAPPGLRTRLTDARKPFKVAIIACARKLLTILNAVIRTGIDYAAHHAA